MLIKLDCIIENVEGYTGKNGYGANITVSQLNDKKRSLLTFAINSAEIASVLEEHLQENVNIELELIQNNFGLRIGQITDFKIN